MSGNDLPKGPTNRGNCPLCKANVPGRHPDRGGTHPNMGPKR